MKQRKTIKKTNENQSGFFEKMNKTDKPVARLTENKEKRHINLNQK